jgi:uncharacterized protein (UPF0264 family)
VRLLVSIAAAAEAAPAVEGGAEILDVKDPARGSLGRASVEVVRAARAVAPAAMPVSAALGDRLPSAPHAIEDLAALAGRLADAGASVLKVGLSGLDAARAARGLAHLVARVREADADGIAMVAVAFADEPTPGGVHPEHVPGIACAAGAAGAMLDTLRKGTSLLDLLGRPAVERWVQSVREHGLLSGIAGSLTIEDAAVAAALGADVVGLRSAVCAGGRRGAVEVERVRLARAAVESARACGSVGVPWR